MVMATTTAKNVVSIYDHSGWVGGDNTQFKRLTRDLRFISIFTCSDSCRATSGRPTL